MIWPELLRMKNFVFVCNALDQYFVRGNVLIFALGNSESGVQILNATTYI
jgi:hypothetical protein